MRWRPDALRLLASVAVLAVAAACSDAAVDNRTPPFQGFDGCRAGADSVVAFLQRTLDEIGDAEPGAAPARVPDFDEGVHALLLRAQEVHCTEEGFNDAVRDRVGDLAAGGPVGEALIRVVRERGLGSLDAARGGPIRLPAG